ncbi:MAG: hypothetical protein HC919_09605 [Oscillatoriales cyanobacterium SM2_2_1]|nr:hypothetical protein [Oscillatoriales cyanobacterium SM2_2_1]
MLGQFRQELLTNGKITKVQTQFFWATCSNYAIAFNGKKVFPADRGWIHLEKKDYSLNYTPARGGLGYYFDVLCPPAERRP